jgi:hypothetical protein
MKAIFWMVVILIGVAIAWLGGSAASVVFGVLFVTTAFAFGFTRSQVRARRRLAALDAYADREIARVAAYRHG